MTETKPGLTQKVITAVKSGDANLTAFLTLISFATVARGAQFLVPLIIYSYFPQSVELDFYFYWSTQSTLIAAFISTIWPAALTSLIVKSRTQNSQKHATNFSVLMLKRFSLLVFFVSISVAFLASNNFLGGPQLTFEHRQILWGIAITIACSSISIAISEIATAMRSFGIAYKSLLASAIVQIIIISVFKNTHILELSFLVGCASQVALSAYFLRRQITGFSNDKVGVIDSAYAEGKNILSLAPPKRIIALLYLGGLFTVLTSHLSYRLLGDETVGAISAFAMASMLAMAPQQLIVQHLSTIAGVAMTESYNQDSSDFLRVSNNWRKRLFRLSLVLGLAMILFAFFALKIAPNFFVLKPSWILVLTMVAFLSLPLALSGLNTWLSRLTISLEKLELGVWYQVVVNAITISLLFACSGNQVPFSTPLALAISAVLQIITIPLYRRTLGV